MFIVGLVQGQQRDRRADLFMPCLTYTSISDNGRLWMCDRCGNIWTAKDIGSTWNTSLAGAQNHMDIGEQMWLYPIAAYGDKKAIVLGEEEEYPNSYILQTTDGGASWDTLQTINEYGWADGHCHLAEGKIWLTMTSHTGQMAIAFSSDSGRSFTMIMPPFTEYDNREEVVREIYMMKSNSGYAGTHDNRLFFTTDNWQTANRVASPLDQGLLPGFEYSDSLITHIHSWGRWLIVNEGNMTYYSAIGGSPKWQPMPINMTDCAVDDRSDALWALDDSGRVVRMESLDKITRFAIEAKKIEGVLHGDLYCSSDAGVLRIKIDGKVDTCGYFTTEKSIEETLDYLYISLRKDYAIEYEDTTEFVIPVIRQGGREWTYDEESIYMKDSKGWYRVAKPLNIWHTSPDPEHSNRVIVMLSDKKLLFSIDTAGHIEPYVYSHPFKDFLKSGLDSVKIQTAYGGCFNYEEHKVTYARNGDLLTEIFNNVDTTQHEPLTYEASAIESALLQLDGCYNEFPKPEDFGLTRKDIDLKKVYPDETYEMCSSYSEFQILLTNRDRETIIAVGSSDQACGDYFPWLLPMQFIYGDIYFATYQPLLWKALRPLMPDSMMLRDHLSNSSFHRIRPGDLLFYRDYDGMGSAISQSTGRYTHVAIVESVGDTVWIIDATPQYGVSRRPLTINYYDSSSIPDAYCFQWNVTKEVLKRARSFIGLPYDHAFLPNNGAMYCSELIYECFISNDEHLFEARPMNWRDANGKIPTYWVEHFKKIGIPIPEGVLGTNPTDLAKSKHLYKIMAY